MPTSSQALILRNVDTGVSHSFLRLGPRSVPMQPALVKSVDINKLFNDMWIEQEMQCLQAYIHGNEHEVRSRLRKILKAKGFHTLLSYNPIKDGLQWNVHQGSTEKPRAKTAKDPATENREIHADTRCRSVLDNVQRRQVSIYGRAKSSPEVPLQNNINSLGFRDSNVTLKPKPPDTPCMRGLETPDSVGVLCSDVHQVLEDIMYDQSTSTTTEKNDEIPDVWKSTKYEERCYPATFQRKILPRKHPLTLCFSLPKNEKYTHEEVKNMLEEEFGCKLKTLQFDPLSVRSGDTIVRNRWIVVVESQNEVDRMVNTGFRLDDVLIVVKTLDEVLLREYNAYLYLAKVAENKKKYNLSHKKSKMSTHRHKLK